MRFLASVLQDVRQTGPRSLLTGLSMLVGVLAIVGVSAAGAITEEVIVAQTEQISGRAATYAFNVNLDEGATTAVNLYDNLRRRLGTDRADIAITAEQTKLASPDSTAAQATLPITWVQGDLTRVRRLPVLAGRIPASDQPYPPWIVLNQDAAGELDLHPGDTLRLSDDADSPTVRFTVMAVIADGSKSLGGYVPLAQATWWHAGLTNAQGQAMVTVPEAAESAVGPAIAAAVEWSGVTASPAARVDRLPGLRQTLQLVQTIFLGCGAVALAVSALGIVNIGLASVNERSRELVIRRAIGATRGEIVAQILGSAVLIGLVASAVAIGAAVAALQFVVPTLLPTDSPVVRPAFPWTACAWGIVAAVTTAVIGALVPALKASHLPVAHALRA